MSTPPKNLNARVWWAMLLDQLELVVPSQILPARVQCPLCKYEHMSITEDYLTGGQWFHCRGCGKSGDMIELAATCWELSIEGTIRKLALRGFDLPVDDASIGNYKNAHIEYRKRLRQLWGQAQPYVYHHSMGLRSLLGELGLPNEFSAEQWLAGPGKMLGGELCRTIEESLLPGSVVCCGNEQIPRCRSARRIFKGCKWQEALVIPFFSAPERICGFAFIGRDGDMSRDFVYRRANVNVGRTQDRINEGGLAMHPDTYDMAVDWQHTVFAVSDPLLYLQVQLRQFTQSNNPLPLVMWVSNSDTRARTCRAWEMFRNCRIVFWDPSMSLATLEQAIAINGSIAVRGPRSNAERLRQYLWQVTPTMLCRKLRKRALPWPKALAKTMSTWTDTHIENLFVQLQLDALQIEKVRKECSHELRRRLDVILKSQQIQRFVSFQKHVVVEKPDGWFCYRHTEGARKLELVSDARLKLSRIVVQKQIPCVGTVIFHGEEIPFTAPMKEIERHPLAWMRDFLLRQSKGPMRFDPKWERDVITISVSFHEPKTVRGTDTVGWDHKRVAFLLPGRIIGLDGTRKLPLNDDTAKFPAARLRYSSAPLPTNWQEMADAYTLNLFWGALAGVLINVMSPALFLPTKGIGLVGKGAESVGIAVAEAAGCLTREIRNLPSARKARQEEQRHHWPLCVPVASNATSAAKTMWLEVDQAHPRNCITTMDEETAERKREEGGWHLLRGVEPATVNANLLGLVRRLVPQYLRDVCRRQLKIEDVMADLAGFIERQGGAVDLEKVRQVLWIAGAVDSGKRCERPRRKAVAAAR